MPRPFAMFFLLLPLVASCASSGEPRLGQLVVTHELHGDTKVIEAPAQTIYALYQPPGTEPGKVCAQVQLDSGKPIGFEWGPTGDLQAVAGETRMLIPDGEYGWRFAVSPEPLPKKVVGKVSTMIESEGQPVVGVLVLAAVGTAAVVSPLALLGCFLGAGGQSY
jgi:hypothetical protein